MSSRTKAGSPGPDGEDGTNGTNGVDGEDGNANVFSSDWFSPTEWNSGTVSQRYYFTHPAPEITMDIINTGVILAYCQLVGSDYTRPLPATTNSGTTVVFWNFYIPEEGMITFTTSLPSAGGASNEKKFR